jgi:hypothetical protein
MSKSSFPTLISYLFIPSLWISAPGASTGSYLNYPTGQANQTLTGTTTVSGLTIGGSNNITLGSGTVTPTVGQLGYTITSTLNTSSISGVNTYTGGTITIPSAGTYLFTLYFRINISGAGNFNYLLLTGTNASAVRYYFNTTAVAPNYTVSISQICNCTASLYYIDMVIVGNTSTSIDTDSYFKATRIA